MPSPRRRSVLAFSATSEPCTRWPRLCRISAMPLMPMPPMPTKWMPPASIGRVLMPAPPAAGGEGARARPSSASASVRAASGRPSSRARAAMSASCSGWSSQAAIWSASQAASISVSPISRPAPAAATASALARWWSSAASRNGTSSAGRPSASSSATLEAPEREITAWASASRAGRSSKKVFSWPRSRARHRRAATRSRSSGRHCWVSAIRARSRALRRAIAAGSTSLSTRAPWLPPITSSLRRSPAAGRL